MRLSGAIYIANKNCIGAININTNFWAELGVGMCALGYTGTQASCTEMGLGMFHLAILGRILITSCTEMGLGMFHLAILGCILITSCTEMGLGMFALGHTGMHTNY